MMNYWGRDNSPALNGRGQHVDATAAYNNHKKTDDFAIPFVAEDGSAPRQPPNFEKKYFDDSDSSPKFVMDTEYFVFCGEPIEERAEQVTFQIGIDQIDDNRQRELKADTKRLLYSQSPPRTVIELNNDKTETGLFTKFPDSAKPIYYTAVNIPIKKGQTGSEHGYYFKCGKYLRTESDGTYVFEHGTVKYEPFVPQIHSYLVKKIEVVNTKPTGNSWNPFSRSGGRGTKSIKKTKRTWREKTRRRRKKKNSSRSR